MSDLVDAAPLRFEYRAQSSGGEPTSGTIDATSRARAVEHLESFGLQAIRVEETPVHDKPGRRLNDEDLMLFNEHLALLAEAGLPIEQGLRLVARDLRSGKLAGAIHDMVDELEKGATLAEAVARHADRFPKLYATLLEAGIKTGNLPGALHNLGRHMELMQRLRRGMWRATAYPLMVLAAFAGLMLFISQVITPLFVPIFEEFDTEIPRATEIVLEVAQWVPHILAAMGALFVSGVVVWLILKATHKTQHLIDHVVLRLPLFGPVFHRNLVARWCDGVYAGVSSGLSLPDSIRLGADLTGSPRLRREGENMIKLHEQGHREMVSLKGAVLPQSVVEAMNLGMDQYDLPTIMATLRDIHAQQTEHRLHILLGAMRPILLFVIMWVVGMTVVAMFLPLVKLIQAAG